MTAARTFHCVEQNTQEWLTLRSGMPTASEFATVLATGRGGGESVTRRKYLNRLAAEIITGEPGPSFSNAATERGHAMEADARLEYEITRGFEVVPGGFWTYAGAGASPDGLVGEHGLAEIKSRQPDLLIDEMLANRFPPEHVAQVQGALWITGREWCDLVLYWPGLPLVVHRATRDEAYIERLEAAVAEFNEELAARVEFVRGYGRRS